MSIPASLRSVRGRRLWFVNVLLISTVVGVGIGISWEATARDGFDRGQTEGTIGADVIVGDLHSLSSWGSLSGITAYSVGTTSCNIGDEDLLWESNNPNHPVIGQNMYRLKEGRLTQIGISWLKHGFLALTGNACNLGCQDPGTGSKLGVGCSDPYGSGLNGSQGGLGPRFEVNAFTGDFLYPFTADGQTGNTIYKRLQVHSDDVNPSMNAGARYFVEGQYITPDDAAAGNGFNNVSYREVSVDSDSSFTIDFIGGASTQREIPGIVAWADVDPTVQVSDFDVPSEGQFIVAHRVQDNGDGTWRYDYGIFNNNSDRSGQAFSIPVLPGAVITDIGFNDVDYHSGEPYDGTDWASSTAGNAVTWSTDTFATESDANALRWGTMYNFWFTADVAPGTVNATLTLFKPGSPSVIAGAIQGPGDGALFSDGFESGDLSAWSSLVP